MKKRLILVLFIIAHITINAQPKPVIKNLVFEGAGIRGIAYCGAIQEMELRGMMDNIERAGGTSAGAIIALIVSLGYTGKEMADIISKTNFRQFNDGRFVFLGGINRINKYFGWYQHKQFEKWIGKIITAKTGNADITFEEFHQKKFIDLYITGTSLNKQKLIIFSHENYPRMKIIDAVKISMTIPFYFEAVFMDKDGKVFYHPKQKQGLDVMVDGGLTGNFPIRLFDSSRYVAQDSTNDFIFNESTMGFRIDSDEQIKNDKGTLGLAPMTVNNVKEYVGAFYNIVIENLNRQTLTEQDWKRTVSISDGKIGPRIRKLSKYEVQTLIENGRAAIKLYTL